MQIIDISTLEFHISTTPNDTQSSKITRIYHDRIRSIDGNGILCQFFESYLLHINIIYNTFHFGCQIQLHISCNHSHIFRLFKLLWKINQRIVQNDLQCISHNSHFQIFIYFLWTRERILLSFWRQNSQERICQPNTTFFRIHLCLSHPDHPTSRQFLD